jgi:cytochrome P450
VRDLQDDVELGGYTIRKGERIACSISLIHTDPATYPNPHAFEPERFLGTRPGTYTWIPFGGGIRRCLGASFALYEMKQVLPAVVQQLDLRTVDPAAEKVARRLITLTPGKRTLVHVAGRRQPAAAPLATMAA